MEMVHRQDVTVELSTRLSVAQREIETPHPATKHRCHHPRLHADGRGLDQRPLCVRHRHLDSHLLSLEFRQGARNEQPLPLRIPQSLGVTQVSNNVVLVIACLMIDVCVCARLLGVMGCFGAMSTTSSILTQIKW
jgi:hypothetical protein